MKGDFSSWRFDPADNDQALLFQQGRVTLDADLTVAERIALHWRTRAGRDVIGAGVAAVPATEPDGFRVLRAQGAADGVLLELQPGRIWADGIHLHLPADPDDPTAPIERLAPYYAPPLAAGPAGPDSIGDGVRDAVILEVALEALNGFQEPERLIEPALGGPDTAERVTTRARFQMLRLGPGEDCTSILGRLADSDAGKGRLTVSLAPTEVIAGDCPVVEGGGYTGFEHNLYRIEVAETGGGAPRFKWSRFNGGLVGRGRFRPLPTPHVEIVANRPAILHSGLGEFYLEALERDPALGHWRVVYGAVATLNNDGELDLTGPATFGAPPATSDTVFFRLWDGLLPVGGFVDAGDPAPLQDGIQLVFDPPAGATYRPGDYWTFPVRAGEIANDEVLIDQRPPFGPELHRVPIAEIDWTDAADTDDGGTIEDCRKRFRPLVNQKNCCTLLVGDGVNSFGDFNSLEEAAAHLPVSGGELCLLPGLHFANLVLDNRQNIRVHGCPRRTLVLPRLTGAAQPIIRIDGGTGVDVADLDFYAPFGAAIAVEGTADAPAREITVEDCRILARTYGIRAHGCEMLTVARNRIWVIDLSTGLAAVSVRARRGLIERNRVGVWPFAVQPPGGGGPGGATPDPTDECDEPEDLFGNLAAIIPFVHMVWVVLAAPPPQQPYRAQGGIHLRGACEDVRVLENHVDGGAGHGITLGGLLPGETPVADQPAPTVGVDVRGRRFFGYIQDESGAGLPDTGLYIGRGEAAVQELRTGADGFFATTLPDGPYELAVDPGLEIVEVREGSLDNVPFYVIVVREVAVVTSPDRAFLARIAIEENEIERMALSGIGFQPHDGERIAVDIGAPDNVADAVALLPVLIAPRELVRTTNLVHDLVIRHNRIHGNLRAVFDEALRALMRGVGLGGITLALVERGSIAGNHILDNGTSATNPTVGVFAGYAEDLEIVDNLIAGNGPLDESYGENRIVGIRGGIVVRLASAMLLGGRTDARQNLAIRIDRNRIDQPAGRAITVYAYGPVSCNGNYLNSEREGAAGLLDLLAGTVLIANLGGVHRQLRYGDQPQPGLASGAAADYTHRSSALLTRDPAFQNFAAAEALLPGGETLVNGNQVRMGAGSRSLVSMLVLGLDDVGIDGNQSSVFRPDLLFANLLCLSPTLRVTDNRLREETSTCFFSALTFAFGLTALSRLFAMNTTAHNQGEHCIIPMSNAPAGGPPVVDDNNLEVLHSFCRQFASSKDSATSFVGSALMAVLAAQTAREAETLDAAVVSTAGLSQSLAGIHSMQTDLHHVQARQAATAVGEPQAVQARLKRNSQALAQLRQQVELAGLREAVIDAETSVIDGRILDAGNAGREDVTVEIRRADGTGTGLTARTDATGYYAIPIDAERSKELAAAGALELRAVDDKGTVLARDDKGLRLAEGSSARRNLVLETAKPTRGDRAGGSVVFEGREPEPTGSTPLENIRGVGPVTAGRLRAAGIDDIETLLRTPSSRLVEIAGFDADVVRREARDSLERARSTDTPAGTTRTTRRPEPGNEE